MKRKRLRFGKGFRVALGTRRSQGAEMVLAPGASEGDAQNRGCNRGQPVGIQPVLQRSAHYGLIRS